MSEPSRAELMTWDWRASLDLEELRHVLSDLTGGRLHLTEVETGSDQYAVLISTTPVGDLETRHMWDEYQRDGESGWSW
jgi:hypothetical protein